MEAKKEIPPESVVKVLRKEIGQLLGLSEEDVEAHAPSSTWRFKLMQKLIELGKDPDTAVGKWAEVGAPMGISEEIESGGWLPRPSQAPT